jgi:hypothetical protein
MYPTHPRPSLYTGFWPLAHTPGVEMGFRGDLPFRQNTEKTTENHFLLLDERFAGTFCGAMVDIKVGAS